MTQVRKWRRPSRLCISPMTLGRRQGFSQLVHVTAAFRCDQHFFVHVQSFSHPDMRRHNPNVPFLDVAVSSQIASKEFMSKFQPLASANRRLKEDKNDKEAQKMYDEYFPMYKNYAA